MPIDDLRPHTPAARPVVDDDFEDLAHGDDPSPTDEPLDAREAAELAAALRDLKDYDEGRLEAIPWEVARIGLFDPPTPAELAEDAAEEVRSRRARR